MSYGPGRSRLVQGTLVGAGTWMVGCLITVGLLVGLFGVFEWSELSGAVLAYSLVVVWFVLLVAAPGGGSLVVLVLPGLLTSTLLFGAGALAVDRVTSVESAWDGAKVGATIAIGHALVMAVAFGQLEWPAASTAATYRTFGLAFGGFVVPAAFGAAGGVLRQQFGP